MRDVAVTDGVVAMHPHYEHMCSNHTLSTLNEWIVSSPKNKTGKKLEANLNSEKETACGTGR